MPFVQRDGGGKIIGLCVAAQGWFTEEFLPETNAEVKAYRRPPPPVPGDQVERGIDENPTMDALIERIAEKEGITKRELINDLRLREKARNV